MGEPTNVHCVDALTLKLIEQRCVNLMNVGHGTSSLGTRNFYVLVLFQSAITVK
jgi:hypothetical protein